MFWFILDPYYVFLRFNVGRRSFSFESHTKFVTFAFEKYEWDLEI